MQHRLDEFVSENANITDLGQLVAHFHEFLVTRYQFSFFSYFLLADQFQSVTPQSSLRHVVAPRGLVEKYDRQNYHQSDPTLRLAARAGAIFTWSEMENSTDLTPDELDVMAFLKGEGLLDGVAMSIFSPPGRLAFVGLSATKQVFDSNPSALRRLYIICSEFHYQYESLLQEHIQIVLTPRETEVVKWVSRGKSNSSIGGILGISTHTVDTLVRRCLRKMNAHNRLELTLRAVSHGLV